jgi:hypothetical protein
MASNASVKVGEQDNLFMMVAAWLARIGVIPMWFFSGLSIFQVLLNTGELFNNIKGLFNWSKPIQKIAGVIFHHLGDFYNLCIAVPLGKFFSLFRYHPSPLVLNVVICLILTTILVILFSKNTYDSLILRKEAKAAAAHAKELAAANGSGGTLGGAAGGAALGLVVGGPFGALIGGLLGGLFGSAANGPNKEQVKQAESKALSLNLAAEAAIRNAAMFLFSMLCLWAIFYVLYSANGKKPAPLRHQTPNAAHAIMDAETYSVDAVYVSGDEDDLDYINDF